LFFYLFIAKNIYLSELTKDKEFAFKEFAKICDLANKYNLKVNLEFVTFSGVTDLNGAASCKIK